MRSYRGKFTKFVAKILRSNTTAAMCLFGFVILYVLLAASESAAEDSNVTAGKPDELARSYGYYVERHEISTADGYILTAFRIVNASTFGRNAVPFILQHGMCSNAGQWVLMGPDRSLAFMLADNGYDVWLSNARGSMHSRKHKTLAPDSADFWDYSWHEKGIYDMPATVDYILNRSRHDEVLYAGHSEGGSIFYVMNSMKPQYNRKVRHAFLLAPAGYMSNGRGAMFAPESITPVAVRGLASVGRTLFKNRFKQNEVMLHVTKKGLCSILDYACAQAVNVGFGFNPKYDIKAMKQGLDVVPDIVTVGEIVHYGQLITKPFTFQLYDYYERNMAKYKAAEPPKYPIHRITTPITFFYAKNDAGISEKDVEQFCHDIPHGHLNLVPDPNFNHLDFVYNPFAKDLINTPILNTANSYYQKTLIPRQPDGGGMAG